MNDLRAQVLFPIRLPPVSLAGRTLGQADRQRKMFDQKEEIPS